MVILIKKMFRIPRIGIGNNDLEDNLYSKAFGFDSFGILNQTYKNWELLIINNNSKDKTYKVIKSFKDKRIRVFKIDNKGLLAKSRNLGINKARSEWICFIDSDDKWFPEKLMKVKQYIDDKEGDLYYHDLVFENKGFF